MKCHFTLFYEDKRSPCLLIDTYQYSQWYLVQVLIHVWKVARALLLLAAEVPSCAPPYENEIFNSKGAFPFLMRQREQLLE